MRQDGMHIKGVFVYCLLPTGPEVGHFPVQPLRYRILTRTPTLRVLPPKCMAEVAIEASN